MRISMFAMVAVLMVAGCGDNPPAGNPDLKMAANKDLTMDTADMTVLANATCGDLIQCINPCMSTKCVTDCLKTGTTTGKALYMTLDTCINTACGDPVGDASAGRCPDTTIAGDCAKCVSNSQSGTDVNNPTFKRGTCNPTNDNACGKCVKALIDCNNDM